ncbi:hypothetical protein TSOC_006022 [Tetrabaena socialis]|uniref:Uncharacterized protein n=1 Tax=Tetrabaena socialis TaxID=47790 RepID=A0A2J8A4T6_9CHLO|nr:hypothetical protein TSOC_006022 [Tetrabaena socialis]|eukprot:PNH07513.1 hypothetical protein TSOC_006022 [Tetrabaena socialis]
MRRDEGDDTSALVAGAQRSPGSAATPTSCSTTLDHLSASQDELGQQLGRLAAALATITAAAAAASPALPPGCSGTVARLQRKAADLSIRLGRVEQRLQRLKVAGRLYGRPSPSKGHALPDFAAR